MANLFMESWDHLPLASILNKWTAQSVGVTDASTIAAVGRRGSNGYQMKTTAVASAVSKTLSLVLAPGDNTAIIGCAVNPVSPFSVNDNGTDPDSVAAANTYVLWCLRDAGATQCWVRLNTTGTVSVLRGTTVLGTTTTALTQGVSTYIETLITVHNTAGAVQIRFNGTSAMTPLASVNTRNGALNVWSEFRLGPISPNTTTAAELIFDDLYINDGTGLPPWNTFFGDVRCDPRVPTAAGTNTGWTPSVSPGVANWDNVNDATPDDDTSYNSAVAAGVTDTFVLEDLPVAGSQIFAVQVNLGMKKTDAGICTVVPIVRHGTTDYAVAGLTPTVAYGNARRVMMTNPGTGVQWTEADFNAAEFGYRRTV